MNILQLHRMSQVTLAAYGQFNAKGAIPTGILEKLNTDPLGFSATQAVGFAGQFDVGISTISDRTSFEATTFTDRVTGATHIGLRGTQQRFGDPSDLDDCAMIAVHGMATEQIVAMYNWVNRIAAPAGTQVKQWKLEYAAKLPTGASFLYEDDLNVFLLPADPVHSSGELYNLLLKDPDRKVTVAGSSMGGHLAIAFATLFPNLVDEAYAFNAPGFPAKPGVDRLFTLLGARRPAGAAAPTANPGSKIFNIVSSEVSKGEDRVDVIAGIGGYPGHGVIIPTEDQFLTDVPDPKPYSWNHDQRQVTDSLAVHALLNKLDPTLDLKLFDPILRSSASGENRSLENIVDAIKAVFGIERTVTPAGNEHRDALYKAIDAIASSSAFSTLEGRLRFGSSVNGGNASGRPDFLSLVCLDTLAPVRMSAAATQAGAVDSALAIYHPVLHARWVQDQSLTFSQRAEGIASFSDRWLDDRSTMLEAILLRNAANLSSIGPDQHPRFGRRVVYRDLQSGDSIATGISALSPSEVQFGADAHDLLSSTARSASLYGGAGADTLRGTAGADWLEGNNDNDSLTGNGGADTLLGGAGNDTLRADGQDSLLGGKGDDRLEAQIGVNTLNGGPGLDRYVFGVSSSMGLIDDSDGSGVIEIPTLGVVTGAGALKLAPNVWQTADRQLRFALIPTGATSALHLSYGAKASIVIRNWRNGGLGITLGDAAPTPVATRFYSGDFSKQLIGSSYAFDSGNYVSTGASPGAMDLISSADVASRISGGGGNDGLAGWSASDLIEGGDDDDLLLGHLGADTLYGGAGSDLIHGSGKGSLNYPVSLSTQPWTASGPEIARGFGWVAYSTGIDANGIQSERLLGADATWLAGDAGNLIDGGAGNDRINAGSGDDTVSGGADHDDITGLGGSDVLSGDDGNDTIAGDGIDLPGYVESVAGLLHGADTIDGGSGNDSLIGQGGSDLLYGGIGDDRLWGDESDIRLTPLQFHGDDLLDAGAGFDELVGGGGNDTLLGGEGNDSLFGDASPTKVAASHHGGDLLDGGAGDDYLEGGGRGDTLIGGIGHDMLWGDTATEVLSVGEGGADLLIGDDGNDTLIGGSRDDTLFGGGGNDLLTADGTGTAAGEEGDDFLDGGAGSDTLYGNGGADVLYGGDQDDLLVGGTGDDYLAGGGGTDVMQGGAGNDTYLVGPIPLNGRGEAESIVDLEGSNRIIFEQIASSSAQVTVLANTSIQLTTATGEALIVDRGATNAANRFEFADGNQFDTHSLIQELSATSITFTDSSGRTQAIGGRNADVLTATTAHATLAGGRGNDRLLGSGGNNLYQYRLGDGSDTIVDTSAQRGYVGALHLNRIAFGPSILASDVRLVNRGGSNGFLVQIGPDPNDSITLSGFDAIASSPSPIGAFRFGDGSELSFAQLAALGFDGTDEADSLFGTSLDDRLAGGLGDDQLTGGPGSDTYQWTPGDDSDTIIEAANAATDILQIGGALSSVDLLLLRTGDDLLVRLRSDATQQVKVVGQFAGNRIERLTLEDGTSWTAADIAARLTRELTTGNDIYSGTSGADLIDAGDGADHVNGLAGNDLIDGGPGDDTLIGGDGKDTLIGSAGRDEMYGEQGDDRLIDGAYMAGGTGSDTYSLTSWRATDIVENLDVATSIDRLHLPVASTAVRVGITANTNGLDPDDLRLEAAGQQGHVVVKRFFEAPGKSPTIEAFHFSDGVSWSIADIYARAPGNTTTDGDDFGIRGFSWNDVIDAKGGNDLVSGNRGDDSILGGHGNDNLYGNVGNDTLVGGPGSDTLHGDHGHEGWQDGNDRLEGGAGADTLQGDGGNDTLDGGAADDELLGGTGDDSYLIDASSGHDRISDGAGIDSMVLGAGVQQASVGLFRDGQDLILTLGQTLAQTRIVNHYSQWEIERIRFADGSSWDAAAIASRTQGGPANAMVGTSANNSFVVDNAADTITEGLNQGNDSVTSSVSYILPANVENLTLSGFVNLSATGNELDNLIVGNAGNNHLDGREGYDTLRGGSGDDVYRINPHQDTIVEGAGQGVDTVLTDWDFVLPENFENLTALSYWYRPIRLTGNSAPNVLAVTSPNHYGNVLDGGAGADTMTSNAPEAVFYVDDPGDVIVAPKGSVVSAIDWTLASGWLDLALTGQASHGIGNAGPNVLMGGPSPDRLEGLAGNDTLKGARGDWLRDAQFFYDSSNPDTLVGGTGDDHYEIDWVSNHRDTVVELLDEGIDTVTVHGDIASYDLADFPNVENLHLSFVTASSVLRGNSGPNWLQGSKQDDRIEAGDGDDRLGDQPTSAYANAWDADTLIGGSGRDYLWSISGRDWIDGGVGNDIVELGADSAATVVFGIGAGTDTVYAEPMSYRGSGRRVVVEAGLRPSDLSLTRDGTNLQIGSRTTASDMLLWNGFYLDATSTGLAGSLTAVDFAGGVSLSPAQLVRRMQQNNNNVATEGADVLLGSAAAESLTGLAGDDLLDGADGNDTLRGGPGSDTIYGGTGDDTFRHERGDGLDRILDNQGDADRLVFGSGIAPADVTVSFADHDELWLHDMLTLQITGTSDQIIVGKRDRALEIDLVSFADGTVWDAVMLIDKATRIAGTSGNDSLIGGDGDDLIYGLAGSDTLRGGNGNDLLDGGTGGDEMRGEAGDDHYIVDATGDAVIEDASQGTDTVSSSISHVLGSHLENLILTGSAAINGTGNGLANRIDGNAGNNLINGGGGADTMAGGAGNDSYTVDHVHDLVLESDNEGIDHVTSAMHHTLARNVENLTLSGSAAINGFGNELANQLTGNAGGNRLEGGAGDDMLDGGAGNDTMIGGTGNDRYVVGSTGDIIIESSGQGIDAVLASIGWTLGDHLENLTLTGSGKIKGTGNSLDNHLIGNVANNELIGGLGHDTLDGGAGNDTLRGNSGDDIYHVNTTGDSVLENANEGTDHVIAPLNWTLGNNLEHLSLTGLSALNGTGNALANRLTGNAGANVLSGLAGADTLDGAGGNDTLVGGTGADTYLFGRGAGTDLVQENDATSGVRDVVLLQGSLTRSDLRFARLSNDLEMSIIGSPDKMVFQNWYLGSAYHAEEFRFSDGSSFNDTEAQALVGAMAAFSASASTQGTAAPQPRMTIGTVDYTTNVVL